MAERFSWAAALVPPVFLLRHGLWLETAGWAVSVLALLVLGAVIGGAAALWIYILLALALGFEAPSLQRHALRWRGWESLGYRVAPSADMAQLEAMR